MISPLDLPPIVGGFFCAACIVLLLLGVQHVYHLATRGNRRKHSKPSPEASAPDVYYKQGGKVYTWPTGQRYPTISQPQNANENATR